MSETWVKARRTWDQVARGIHTIHGTRGLGIGAGLLLVLSLVDPILPDDADRLLLTTPVFIVLVIGLATLPREGVAAEMRVRALLQEPDGAARLVRRLVWPGALCILLAPRIFLAAYGIPHLNPLTGLVLPVFQQTITVAFLFLVTLVPVFGLRATKRYAPHILAKRPRDLSRLDRSHQERDWLLWMMLGIVAIWAWLLHAFWTPFSLLQWPPSLATLSLGVRGVASITFALAIPALMFMQATAHLALLRDIGERRSWSEDRNLVVLATVHVLLSIGVLVLHAYDLLWIVQYRSALPF